MRFPGHETVSIGNRVRVNEALAKLFCSSIQAPFIWSRVPETTLPRVTLGEVTFSLILCKINQPFTSGLRTRLGGRDNSGGRVVSPRQVGYQNIGTQSVQELFFCSRSIRRAVYSNGLFKFFGCDVQQERNWEFMMCIRCYIGNSKIAK